MVHEVPDATIEFAIRLLHKAAEIGDELKITNVQAVRGAAVFAASLIFSAAHPGSPADLIALMQRQMEKTVATLAKEHSAGTTCQS